MSARTGEGVDALRDWLAALPERRMVGGVTRSGAREPEFFAAEADRLSRRCADAMAERFARGGRLLAVGRPRTSDARHVAVEFVHPVIVGKRALPALGAAAGIDVARLEREPDDIVIAFGDATSRGRAIARERGCLVLALAVDDPFVAPGAASRRSTTCSGSSCTCSSSTGPLADGAGASRFLYPFLRGAPADLDAVLADVRALDRCQGAEVGGAARADARRQRRRARRPPRGAALRRRRTRARAGQRRLGDRRDGRRRRPARARAARRST